MVIHEKTHDMVGAGKWDIHTTRYIPIYGGSRSKLPIFDDPEYRRYHGFVGIDEYLTEHINLIAQLYAHLGGKAIIMEGPGGEFTSLILGQTLERLEAESAAGTDKPAL